MEPTQGTAPDGPDLVPAVAVGGEMVVIAGQVDDRLDPGIGEDRELEVAMNRLWAAGIFAGENLARLCPPRVELLIKVPSLALPGGPRVERVRERLDSSPHRQPIEPRCRNS